MYAITSRLMLKCVKVSNDWMTEDDKPQTVAGNLKKPSILLVLGVGEYSM